MLLLLGWELYVRARGLEDYVLPAPSQVWRALVDMAPDLGPDVRATMIEATFGLVVGAVGGRRARGRDRALAVRARRAVYPLLVISQTIPAIVFAPILIVWLGFGLMPKIVVVALVAFFPVVVSTVDGLVNADDDLVDLVHSFGAGRWQRLRLVQGPSALPSFFAGLKIAATYAVIGAVIAEWMGASEGLGLVMTRASQSFRTDRVFAAVVVVALVSLVAVLDRPARGAPGDAVDRRVGVEREGNTMKRAIVVVIGARGARRGRVRRGRRQQQRRRERRPARCATPR